ANAAFRMVCASSGVNAFVSRSFVLFGIDTLTSANGLLRVSFCFCAQANTVRAATTHTSATVRAERLGVTSAAAQSLASSSVIELAVLPTNRALRSMNTARHRSTVLVAGLRAAIHLSNRSQAERPASGPSNLGNRSTYVSGEWSPSASALRRRLAASRS